MNNTPQQQRQPAQPENAPTGEQTRKQALAKYLDVDVEDLTGDDDDEQFELGSKEYLVLTDSEADKRAADYIKDSVWAFNASFLASYTDLPEAVFTALQPQCESANDAILQLIEHVNKTQHPDAEAGIDGFVQEAISADGRCHFLNTYDGEENEEGEYFIYRTN